MINRRRIKDKVAELLRQFSVVQPPVDVERIARRLGTRVRETGFDGDVSGLFVRKGQDAVIGVNSMHSEQRKRFTIAHEIGHFVLHISKPIYVDELVLHFRNRTSAEGRDPDEIEANAFAAELLMPEDFVQQSMSDLDNWDDEAVSKLAKEYKVSVEAFVYRLTNLGYMLDL